MTTTPITAAVSESNALIVLDERTSSAPEHSILGRDTTSVRNRWPKTNFWTWTSTILRTVVLGTVYSLVLVATGAWMRQLLKITLGIVPSWARSFVQPILILYYFPLFALRQQSLLHFQVGETVHPAASSIRTPCTDMQGYTQPQPAHS
jgi:hypothetical protein